MGHVNEGLFCCPERPEHAKCYEISGPVNQASQDCWAKAQIIVEPSYVQFPNPKVQMEALLVRTEADL
jgi:hypothetical protein